MQPAPFDISVGRYAPGLTFPPYRHVPGHTPHPRTDPAGHSHGLPEPASEELRQDNWHAHPAYLFGADLFNHAYWWEAHEQWEVLWHLAGRQTSSGLYLQGLIQTAAALIKWHQGNRRGRGTLWGRGRGKLARVGAVQRVYMGLDLEDFIERLDGFFASCDSAADGHPRIVLRG